MRPLQFIRSQTQLVILVVVFLICAAVVPEFLNERTVLNILKTVATSGIVAIGLSVVVIGGNLDLSVGSVFSLMCVVSVKMQNTSPWLGLIVPIVLAVGVGALNGFLVTRFRLNSIIVTLGTMSVWAGAALLYSPTIMTVPGTFYEKISNSAFLGIPTYVYVFFAAAIVLQVVLFKTKFGRSLFFQGVNPEAAEIAGINKNRSTILSMVICSICVAIGAILQTSRVGSGYPISGVGLEFSALTAVLLGGVSIAGGKGSALRTVIGVLMLQVILTGMILMDIKHDWQSIVKGALILVALTLDAWQQRAAARNPGGLAA
ncbi:MAG: ABC transporter permease [Clostridiales Family XIII bacterium]|jgi:ribose/xylose/arabinose/galactoside ABC-type transport system permease subunit|nr:ABC transporter permease [Clostridiales Family XIII bacterium]